MVKECRMAKEGQGHESGTIMAFVVVIKMQVQMGGMKSINMSN